MKLSVIVPVFNECTSIGKIIRRVLDLDIDKEIIVIDDGSTDGTRKVLEQFASEPGIIIHTLDRNRGKGHAIRVGMQFVTGEVVVIQDADLEYDPQDFMQMIKPIRDGVAQVVYGSRRLNKDNRQYSGILYWLGGLLVTYTTRLLYGIAITDEATCYKMIKTDLLRSLNLTCERFEFCPEVTAKLALRKIHIHEVPISYFPRHKKEGKKIGWRDALEALWTLARLRMGA